MKTRQLLACFLAVTMTAGLCACGAKPEEAQQAAGSELVKESPILAEQVAAGTLPALEERLPVSGDVYVESDNAPQETPAYGGTLRSVNGGMWHFGPVCEEPLFRLEEDGSVSPNVAKGYDLSEDGLTYTIHLREGMRWSDGTPFTAEDCVYYYNYMLVSDVDPETHGVLHSYTGKKYNWYMSADPNDGGVLKPAQVRKVDDTTFTITLYSPKPTLLQAICIDNKWMFAPKEWYKDIVAHDTTKEHWSGETDLSKIGGEGLSDISEEQALENAAAKSELYKFEDYTKLGDQLGYRYWQYAGRPTLRPWNNTSPLTSKTLVFERNPYFWKVDQEGRQLPYVDTIEFIEIDAGLYAQEMAAQHLDFLDFTDAELPIYKSNETSGNYRVTERTVPNWTTAALELNQGYKDRQYAKLFSNIDFRHALSIAVNRDEMNEILSGGLSVPAQFAAPEGSVDYIAGAPEKWTEYNVDEANALLDGIDMISKERNADGYRTFVDGENAGKPVTLNIETMADAEITVQGTALLKQYYQEIGVQVVEVSNTDLDKRAEKFYVGDIAMASFEKETSVFNAILRPDYLAANRCNYCWIGKYGLDNAEHLTPEPGSEIEEIVQLTGDLVRAKTMDELQAVGQELVKNHHENTWIIGFLSQPLGHIAVSNRIHNFPDTFEWCDELRYFGNAKPYTWFLEG